MVTKRSASRKRATKKSTQPKKKAAKKQAVPKKMYAASNRDILENAGVIKGGHVFSPQDSAAIESLSGQEVNALISVYNNLGQEMLENNSPHGIVF